MDSINLSSTEQTHIQQKQQQVALNPQTLKQSEQKKDGKKLLIVGAAALATVAVAGIMIYKGKAPKKLADVQFDGGKAKKGGKLFTGIIEDTKEYVQDGAKVSKKIKLEYKDGVIQKAITETNGEKVVKEYVDGVITKKDGKAVDIKKIQDEVKNQQEKLKKLLNNDTFSYEEFSKQASEIKYKSKNQQKEIDKVADMKVTKEVKEYFRQEAKELALKEMKENEIYNSAYEALKHPLKFAKESATIIENNLQEKDRLIKAEVQKRTEIQNNIKNAQAKENAYLEEKLSKKSAQESASYIEQALIEQEQEKINKPFTEVLSNKSAKESAEAIASGGDTKRTMRISIFDEEGNIVRTDVKSKKTGQWIESHSFDENGNVIKSYLNNGYNGAEIVYEPYGKVVYGNGTTKFYEKNDKGKYVVSQRRKVGNGFEKIVEQHEDCSVTTIFDNHKGTKQVIIRDKKGNILSKNISDPDKPKQLAEWYVNYQKLCKKYGIEPREYGAWDHFCELRIMSTDSKEYENYIRSRNYRAQYDLKAKLMEVLDSELDENYVTLCKQIANNKTLRSQFSDEQIIEMLDIIKNNKCLNLPKIRSILNEFSNPNREDCLEALIYALQREIYYPEKLIENTQSQVINMFYS